jgi:hypothetical protein
MHTSNSKESFLPSNSKESFLPSNSKEPFLPSSSKEFALPANSRKFFLPDNSTKLSIDYHFTPFRKPDTDLKEKLCSQNMFVNKITVRTFPSDSFYSGLRDALTMSKHSSGNCDWPLFALSWFYSQECFSTHRQTYTFLMVLFASFMHAYIAT